MFIKLQKSPTTPRVQVHLVEGYRDETGKVRHRSLKNYGVLSELQAKEPDVLTRLKAEAKELTRRKKDEKVSVDIDCLRGRCPEEHPVNYGYFLLEGIYRKLGLHTFLKKNAQQKAGSFDLEAIVELLVFSRILNPGSKAATYQGKDGFFRDFDFEIHDVYRALDVLDALADDIQLHVHRAISKRIGRDAALVFYDVTNYYFECDFEDDFRRKGPSKEHRQDPIVQMGLLIDGHGIPIAYRLFEGNTHDAKTLVPVLEELKGRYGFGRIVVVADKGLNAKDNLAYITGASDGYIVSQKVRGRVDPEITRHIRDTSGWTFNETGSFAYKSFVRQHTITKDRCVTEKVVCFWSEQYAKREAYKRGELVEGIEYLVEHPAAYDAKNDYGRKRYVKEIMLTETGEVVNKHLAFNGDRFKADAALDGFYCILTSETEMVDIEIIEHYRGLVRIEESFRVIKSDLEGRPVYVWTRPHINAHFLICFLALVLLRVIQDKVDYSLSAEAIKDAFIKATCTPLEKGIYVVEETTDAYKELEKVFGVDLPNRYAPVETIKAYRKEIIAKA
jgi:transposase